ncbi:hypothetical protein TSUD_80580 [Trifolium subterraneum]|uniref:Uncharacterized protein n=1 Tax=Trifolium subterraneum TaxID=3900 RepID=A0A2Z6LLI6_TRISU|nr:hypothetical protein TSUD_80580 [Trifolium subterraneum]
MDSRISLFALLFSLCIFSGNGKCHYASSGSSSPSPPSPGGYPWSPPTPSSPSPSGFGIPDSGSDAATSALLSLPLLFACLLVSLQVANYI